MNIGVEEPPGVQNFSRWPGPHAAAHVEQLAQGDAERGLVLAGAGDVAAERVEREARGLLAAHRPEPVLAALQDRGNRGDGLDVVHHSGAGVEARDGREGGTQPGLAAAAFQRVEQRGLLTADVRAGARVHGEFEVESAAQDVLAEVARLVRLAHGLVQPPQHGDDLAAQVDEGVRRADRVAGDHDALDEGVRVGEEERDVLAGPRLRLVGVDDEIVRLCRRPAG